MRWINTLLALEFYEIYIIWGIIWSLIWRLRNAGYVFSKFDIIVSSSVDQSLTVAKASLHVTWKNHVYFL